MERHCEGSRLDGRIGGSRARCACSNADGGMRGMVDGGIELCVLALGGAVAAMDMLVSQFSHIVCASRAHSLSYRPGPLQPLLSNKQLDFFLELHKLAWSFEINSADVSCKAV